MAAAERQSAAGDEPRRPSWQAETDFSMLKRLSLARPHKRGQANKYFAHELLADWQSFLEEGADLRPLLGQYAEAVASAGG